MSRLPGETRKSIIDLGEKLLLNQGFNGFSYADIAASLGIKNAAVHYHFPTKCDLGLEIIRCARQRFDKWGASRKTQDMPAPERLDAFFASTATTSQKADPFAYQVLWKPIIQPCPRPCRKRPKGWLKTCLHGSKSFWMKEG